MMKMAERRTVTFLRCSAALLSPFSRSRALALMTFSPLATPSLHLDIPLNPLQPVKATSQSIAVSVADMSLRPYKVLLGCKWTAHLSMTALMPVSPVVNSARTMCSGLM